MKKIPLIGKHKDKFVLVDDMLYPYLSQFRWFGMGGYAARSSQGKQIKMHREIYPDWEHIDHINGNSLDNRLSNLRECTISQNAGNQRIPINNSSRYKGVDWKKDKWAARIQIQGKRLFLGLFTNKKMAAKAYNKAAKQYFGEYAKLNTI